MWQTSLCGGNRIIHLWWKNKSFSNVPFTLWYGLGVGWVHLVRGLKLGWGAKKRASWRHWWVVLADDAEQLISGLGRQLLLTSSPSQSYVVRGFSSKSPPTSPFPAVNCVISFNYGLCTFTLSCFPIQVGYFLNEENWKRIQLLSGRAAPTVHSPLNWAAAVCTITGPQ